MGIVTTHVTCENNGKHCFFVFLRYIYVHVDASAFNVFQIKLHMHIFPLSLSPPSLSPRLQRLCTPQNVNCIDMKGRLSTPLHFACGYNKLNVVEYLLKNGADVHVKDKG